MENTNRPNPEGNATRRPGSCGPFTIEFTTNSEAHKMGQQQYIELSEAKIGRSADCSIRFGDDATTVSREHAQIKCLNGKYILEHLSATNSTFVNGKKVGTEYTLSHRDTIQLSDNGPKMIFIAPGAIGSNVDNESAVGGQSTARSSNATVKTDSSGTQRVGTEGMMGSCLPFTIEYGRKSQANYEGQRKTISDSSATIGRAANSLIHFGSDCNEISSEHAIIKCKEGRWYIEHKSKSNPTFVNNKPVATEQALNHGDTIHLASLNGQFIKFYQSGTAATTGRMAEGAGTSVYGGGGGATGLQPQPSLSSRLSDMVSKSSQTQKMISIGLGVGLLVMSVLLGLNWWNNRVEAGNLKNEMAANQKADEERRKAEEKAAEDKKLQENFPDGNFEKYIFFVEGQITLEMNGKTRKFPEPVSGTAFLDNRGNLITARHVVKLTDFQNCKWAMTKMAVDYLQATMHSKLIFNAPSSQETVTMTDPLFSWVDTKPLYSTYCEGVEIKSATCAPHEDWAVIRVGALSKLAQKSTIEVDRELSKDMSLAGSKDLYLFGYRDSKSKNPQLKKMRLDLVEPTTNKTNSFINFKVFKVSEPTFSDDDSGSPVFAFSSIKKRWVVVGIAIKKEDYWYSGSTMGIILPIHYIYENLLQ